MNDGVPTTAAVDRGGFRVDAHVQHLRDIGLLEQNLLSRYQSSDRVHFRLVEMEQFLEGGSIDVRIRQETLCRTAFDDDAQEL